MLTPSEVGHGLVWPFERSRVSHTLMSGLSPAGDVDVSWILVDASDNVWLGWFVLVCCCVCVLLGCGWAVLGWTACGHGGQVGLVVYWRFGDGHVQLNQESVNPHNGAVVLDQGP